VGEAKRPAGNGTFDAVVIGAGFAGLSCRIGCRGLGFTARLYATTTESPMFESSTSVAEDSSLRSSACSTLPGRCSSTSVSLAPSTSRRGRMGSNWSTPNTLVRGSVRLLGRSLRQTRPPHQPFLSRNT
jgi:hypothetical protein